jgi:catechol 2,3-dioxygenase-like lactoylglutathione lyase family enzyme
MVPNLASANRPYSSAATTEQQVLYDSGMPAIARLSLCAFDTAEPRRLAEFYAAITGWEVDRDDGDWIQLRSGGGVTLAFQLAPDHQPPEWPSTDHPQQAHLDFDVDDLDVGEAAVIELGARKTDVQPMPDSFRVFLDPAGHPFCLVLAD